MPRDQLNCSEEWKLIFFVYIWSIATLQMFKHRNKLKDTLLKVSIMINTQIGLEEEELIAIKVRAARIVGAT